MLSTLPSHCSPGAKGRHCFPPGSHQRPSRSISRLYAEAVSNHGPDRPRDTAHRGGSVINPASRADPAPPLEMTPPDGLKRTPPSSSPRQLLMSNVHEQRVVQYDISHRHVFVCVCFIFSQSHQSERLFLFQNGFLRAFQNKLFKYPHFPLPGLLCD